MKPNNSSLALLSFLSFIVGASFVFSGCVAGAESASPMLFGYGASTAPGWQLGDGNSSVHVVGSYTRYGYKGGGGHNNFVQLGGQFRQSLSKADDGLWVAGELSYMRITSKTDNVSIKPTASGFAVGPVVGYRFTLGSLPFSAYVAPEYLRRGGFKVNGGPAGPSGSGFYGRLGIDFHFLSLLHRKGR